MTAAPMPRIPALFIGHGSPTNTPQKDSYAAPPAGAA
jgi:aromatic ring-opening dioxygenase catalytic subunit (LigB family)